MARLGRAVDIGRASTRDDRVRRRRRRQHRRHVAAGPGPLCPGIPHVQIGPLRAEPRQGRRRAGRRGRGPRPADRLRRRRHGDRSRPDAPVRRGPRTGRPGHRLACRQRRVGGPPQPPPLGHEPRLQPARQRADPGLARRHPVRLQGVPGARRPSCSSTARSPSASPSTSRSCRWPAGSASPSPRSRCSGCASREAGSGRGPTRGSMVRDVLRASRRASRLPRCRALTVTPASTGR